jgi:hypothetical protein
VTYLWTTSKDKSALKKTVDLLLLPKKKSTEDDDTTTEQSAKCIFNAYFEQRVRNISTTEGCNLPESVIPCNDPDTTVSFSNSFDEAVKIFHQCESEAEFMPPAPEEQDPEDY